MEITLTVENLTITQTVIEGQKFNTVMRDMGDYSEEVSPADPDYRKMIIHLHNYKNG